MNLLAIDPGQDTGWANFTATRLTSCGLVHPSKWGNLECPAGGLVVIEEPTIYPHSKADPANIMALQLKVGQLMARFELQGFKVELVQPRVWKGQVPKEICHARALKRLTDEERRLCYGAKHDTLDAVALGVWRLRR